MTRSSLIQQGFSEVFKPTQISMSNCVMEPSMRPIIDISQFSGTYHPEVLKEMDDIDALEEQWLRDQTDSDVPDDDGFVHPLERELSLMDFQIEEFEKTVAEQERTHSELLSTLGELRARLDVEPWEPDFDAPLNIAQAVCLPELGGTLFRGGKGIKSDKVTLKTLRGAIARGELAVVRLNSKNLFVTRSDIKEWLISCRSSTRDRSSGNGNPVMTKTESLPTVETSSSMTLQHAQDKLRRDAVLAATQNITQLTKRRT